MRASRACVEESLHAANALLALGLVLWTLSSTGCTGGANSSNPNVPPTGASEVVVSGLVQVPNGQVAYEPFFPSIWNALAQSVQPSVASAVQTGLAAVPDGTIVHLIQLDANAAESSVLASTRTSQGQYFFNLTAVGLQFASDLIVQVIGPSNKPIRAFVVGSIVDINPASESAYQLVTETLRGRPLQNLTLQEMADCNGAVRLVAALMDGAPLNNLEQAVNLIKETAISNNTIVDFMDAASSDGQTTYTIGDIGNYVALEQGNVWQYSVTKTENGRLLQTYANTLRVEGHKVVTGANGSVDSTVMHESNPDGTGNSEQSFVVKDSVGLLSYGNSDLLDNITPQLIPYQLLRFPLGPGSRYTQVQQPVGLQEDLDHDGQQDRADLEAVVDVLNFEDIVVPAGTFRNAVKIQTTVTLIVTFSSTRSQTSIVTKETVWYAPGVGAIRKTRTTQGNSISEIVTEELQKFFSQLRFTSIGTGSDHSCGVTVTGTGYCWGNNDSGELGDGTTTTSGTPVQVAGNLTFKAIQPGSHHTCGIIETGTAYCWGLGVLLGTGGTINSHVPVAVAGGHLFTSLSLYYEHTCGVTVNADAYCWGWNQHGQLGSGFAGSNSLTPVQVVGGLAFRSIDAGVEHTCAVATDGKGYCWGNQNLGELGNGNTAPGAIADPQQVLGGLQFSNITVGGFFSCGLTSSGRSFCWGSNLGGRLGNGGEPQVSSVPVPVEGDLAFAELDSGIGHTCGLTDTGNIFCWGENGSFELGNGTNISSLTPIPASTNKKFERISAGYQYACALESISGRPYCWGDYFSGKIGYQGGYGPESPNRKPFPVSLPQ